MFGPTLQQTDRKWYAGWSQKWWYHNFCQWESDDHPFQLEQWSKEVGKQFSELRMTFTCINTLNTQWRVVWDFTPHKNTLNEGWCETLVWDFTWHKNTLNEGWCETVVWDFTSHKNTLNEGWCETLVWDFTSHKNALSHSMKGGVRLWCETLSIT